MGLSQLLMFVGYLRTTSKGGRWSGTESELLLWLCPI